MNRTATHFALGIVGLMLFPAFGFVVWRLASLFYDALFGAFGMHYGNCVQWMAPGEISRTGDVGCSPGVQPNYLKPPLALFSAGIGCVLLYFALAFNWFIPGIAQAERRDEAERRGLDQRPANHLRLKVWRV